MLVVRMGVEGYVSWSRGRYGDSHCCVFDFHIFLDSHDKATVQPTINSVELEAS